MSEVDIESRVARRPLSPHLSVYTPMLTMMMSIAHRISGVSLYLGALLLAFYLLGLALGPGAFGFVSWIANGFVGHVIVFAFIWALFHHLLGGARHALWDRGLYMDPRGRETLAQATLGGGVALMLLLWIASGIFG